jgi:hypothetical protein
MPTDADAIVAYVNDALRRVNTVLPGQIDSYDPASGKASVRPLLREKYADGDVLELPVIDNVPLVFPRTGEASISLPVARGDGVLLLFCQRSMDTWLSSGGVANPDDIRMHSLSDAIAIPGLVPFSVGGSGTTDLVIQRGSAQFKIDGSDKIAFGTSSAELLDLLDQVIDAIIASNCVNGAPLTEVTAGTFGTIKSTLATIKGSI